MYNVQENESAARYSMIVGLVSGTPILPLVGMFRDGKLAAVVFGFHSESDWRTIERAQHNGVAVYSNLYSMGGILHDKIIEDRNTTTHIARLFTNSTADELTNIPRDLITLLPLIASAAAIDAVNPCEFFVLTVFLSIVYFRSGRKALLKAGIAFSTAIFIAYYLMGLGLMRLVTVVQEVRLLVVVLGFFVGLREILGTLLDRKIKRVPNLLSERLSSSLRRASDNPLTSFGIGVLTTLLLLPCTSGPYFIAASLIANLEGLFEGLLLLTVYNSIIITPFLAITVAIYTLKLRTSDLKKWSAQRQRWLNLAAGLLMILLSAYLLSTVGL